MSVLLMIEACDMASIDNVVEEAAVTGKPKNYYIRGPYLEAETKNGNGRVYPRSIIEREVQKMMETKIKQSRAVGELQHPQSAEINLDRVSHVIKELRMEGNIGWGNSLVIPSTPMGQIAIGLLDAGVKLGVSSRGLGTLKESRVQDDYRLITVDIVADPSAPSAFVDGILEMRTYTAQQVFTEQDVEELETKLDKYTREDKQTALLRCFEEAMAKIAKKVI